MHKERLKKYVALKKEQIDIKNRIADVEAKLYDTKQQILSDMPKAHGVPNYTPEKLIDLRKKLLEVYREHQQLLDTELLRIESAIGKVPDPTARELLRFKYIDGLTWEEVYIKLNYSSAQTHRIHARALRMIRHK